MYSRQVVGPTTIYTDRFTPAPCHSTHHSQSRNLKQGAVGEPAGPSQSQFSLDPQLPARLAFEQWMAKWYQPFQEGQAGGPTAPQRQQPGTIMSEPIVIHQASEPTVPVNMSAIKAQVETRRIPVSSAPLQLVSAALQTHKAVKSVRPTYIKEKQSTVQPQTETVKVDNRADV